MTYAPPAFEAHGIWIADSDLLVAEPAVPTPELSRNDLLDALGEVAAIMHSRGQRGRVYVVGGAAARHR